MYVSDYWRAKEGKPVPAYNRHLNAKASITDIAADVENDRQESVRKFAQPHGVSTKTVHATLHKDLKLF
jgi:hypothetical protein